MGNTNLVLWYVLTVNRKMYDLFDIYTDTSGQHYLLPSCERKPKLAVQEPVATKIHLVVLNKNVK